MRKWWIPIAVLGAGGLGAYFYSDKGRETLRRLLSIFDGGEEQIDEWNDGAQAELDSIQSTLNQIAQSLQPQH